MVCATQCENFEQCVCEVAILKETLGTLVPKFAIWVTRYKEAALLKSMTDDVRVACRDADARHGADTDATQLVFK